MHNRTVYLMKPDGTVGFEFHVGILPDSELLARVRKAALEAQAGTENEIASWNLVVGSPEDKPEPLWND